MKKRFILNLLVCAAIAGLPIANSVQVSHAADTSTTNTSTNTSTDATSSTDETATDQSSQNTVTNGLQTSYFSDDQFTSLLSIQWGDTDPLKNLGDNTVKSIKIVGTITADEDESLTVQSDYSTKVVIDSQVVYDNDAGKTGTIDLTSGQHQIVWTATADSGFSQDGKLEIVDSNGQPLPVTSLLPQISEKPTPTLQTKSFLVQTDPTTDSTTSTDSQIDVTADPSATNELDSDDDGIPNDWEINGYTYCTVGGTTSLRKWDDSYTADGCKKLVSDPNAWTTNGDPFSDLQEATGIGMPAATLAVKPNDPLVPAYPDVQVELDSYSYEINGNITTTDGKTNTGSHTTNTTTSHSETITNGGSTSISVANKIKGSLNPFQTGAETTWTVSQNYTHSDANQSSSSNSDGYSESNAQNWSQAVASNPSAAANLTLNVHYVNHGTAPVEDYVPTFSLNIGGKAVDTLSPNLTATNIDPVGAAEPRYPPTGSVAITQKVSQSGLASNITLFQDDFNELQEGYPLVLDSVDMKEAKISTPKQDGKKEQVDWGQYLSDINNTNATIHVQNTDNGDYFTRKVYAKPDNGHALAPTVTLGDALKRAFNATQDANGNLTINGQVVNGDGYVISGKDAATSLALYDFVNQGGNLADFPLSPGMDIYLDHIDPSAGPQIIFAQSTKYNDTKEIDAYIRGNGTIIDGVYAVLNGKEVEMNYDSTRDLYILPTDSLNYDPNGTNSVEIKYRDADGNTHQISQTITDLQISPTTTIPLDLTNLSDPKNYLTGVFANNSNDGNMIESEYVRPAKLEATSTDQKGYLNKTIDDEDSKGHTYEFQVYLRADQDTDTALRVRNKDKTDDSGSVLKVLSNPNDPNSELVDGQVTTDWQKFTTGPIDFTHDNTGGYVRTTIYPAGDIEGATGTIYAYGAVLLKDGVPVKEYDPNLEYGPGLNYVSQTSLPKIASGKNPSVAVNNKGQVVVVSESATSNSILSYTGQMQDDGSIKWYNKKDSKGNLIGVNTGFTGITPSVSINDNGAVLMVQEGSAHPNRLYAHIGKFVDDKITWANWYGYLGGGTVSEKLAQKGHHPSVALANDGKFIIAFNGNGSNDNKVYDYTGQVFYTNNSKGIYNKATGDFDVTNSGDELNLGFDPLVNYDYGYEPSVSLADDGTTVVEAHIGEGKFDGNVYYDVGTLSHNNSKDINEITWTKTDPNYDGKIAYGRFIGPDSPKGYTPSIDVNSNGQVLATYRAEDTTGNSKTYYTVGYLNGNGGIDFPKAKKFASSSSADVALTDDLHFITAVGNNVLVGSGSLQMSSATDNFDNWNTSGGVTIDTKNTNVLSIDGNSVVNLIAPGEYSYSWIENKQSISSTAGRTVTFSVYLRSDIEQDVRLRIKDQDSNGNTLESKNEDYTVGPDWKLYTVTLNLENDSDSVDSVFYPAGYGTNVAGSVQAYGAILKYTD